MEQTYDCNSCDFHTPLKTNYERHVLSAKHKKKNPGVDTDVEKMKKELMQDYELKLEAMKNEFTQILLQAKAQANPTAQAPPSPTVQAPPPPIAYAQYVPHLPIPVVSKKVLPITFVKKGMKKASVIEKYVDEFGNCRYRNGRDIYQIKDLITDDDVESYIIGNHEETVRSIIYRFIGRYEDKSKMPIVCIDKRRERFLFHIKLNDKIDWIEDKDMMMITIFLKGIIDFISFKYAEKNPDDMSMLASITGTIDEHRPNYCMKKLKGVCRDLFCISSLVDEFNDKFNTIEMDSE